jgi:hypothetical protein
MKTRLHTSLILRLLVILFLVVTKVDASDGRGIGVDRGLTIKTTQCDIDADVQEPSA